jgi:hypothetical protein
MVVILRNQLLTWKQKEVLTMLNKNQFLMWKNNWNNGKNSASNIVNLEEWNCNDWAVPHYKNRIICANRPNRVLHPIGFQLSEVCWETIKTLKKHPEICFNKLLQKVFRKCCKMYASGYKKPSVEECKFAIRRIVREDDNKKLKLRALYKPKNKMKHVKAHLLPSSWYPPNLVFEIPFKNFMVIKNKQLETFLNDSNIGNPKDVTEDVTIEEDVIIIYDYTGLEIRCNKPYNSKTLASKLNIFFPELFKQFNYIFNSKMIMIKNSKRLTIDTRQMLVKNFFAS